MAEGTTHLSSRRLCGRMILLPGAVLPEHFQVLVFRREVEPGAVRHASVIDVAQVVTVGLLHRITSFPRRVRRPGSAATLPDFVFLRFPFRLMPSSGDGLLPPDGAEEDVPHACRRDNRVVQWVCYQQSTSMRRPFVRSPNARTTCSLEETARTSNRSTGSVT